MTGLSGGWVSIALLVYGLGTIAGNTIAGRVRPTSILRVLPVPLAVLTLILAAQGGLMRTGVGAMAAVFVLGAAAFTVAPLLQTWLMGEAGPARPGWLRR